MVLPKVGDKVAVKNEIYTKHMNRSFISISQKHLHGMVDVLVLTFTVMS